MVTAAVVRTLLVVDMVGMALLALFFLRHRRMDWVSYFFWGILAVGVPVIGPFVVIAKRPGQWVPEYSVIRDFQSLGTLLSRLLPSEPIFDRKKTTLAERVRRRKQSRDRKTPR